MCDIRDASRNDSLGKRLGLFWREIKVACRPSPHSNRLLESRSELHPEFFPHFNLKKLMTDQGNAYDKLKNVYVRT